MPRSAALLLLALSCALWSPARAGEPGKKAGVTKAPFGKTADGKQVDLDTLTNDKGMTAKVITYGATLTQLLVPDKSGEAADVVLGFDDLKGYLANNTFFGSTVGRYAYRIARGRFTLDGKTYRLATNNKPNHLHGGDKGFDKVVWSAKPVTTPRGVGVRFSYKSRDGEEGYPGNLSASVTYLLARDRNELWLHYTATTDKATPVNLSNHTYFNLAGQGSGDILGQEMMIAADRYTPTDETLIPTGELKPVKGTPYDFTRPHTIGSRIKELKGEGKPGGYDINYVLNSGGGKLALGARARDPKSGRVMEMWTTEPGVQFYTGNFLDGSVKGKGGVAYGRHAGFCLEAQHFPDSPNKKEFPSTILRPGKVYTQTTVYKFPAK